MVDPEIHGNLSKCFVNNVENLRNYNFDSNKLSRNQHFHGIGRPLMSDE